MSTTYVILGIKLTKRNLGDTIMPEDHNNIVDLIKKLRDKLDP